MSQQVFIVHILTANGWAPLAQSGKAPYTFDSAGDAWRMADICYPDQCREMRLGGPEQVRVTALSPWFERKNVPQPTNTPEAAL